MSSKSINYNTHTRGAKLITSEEAWTRSKNGKLILNPKYTYIGKLQMTMPNMLVSASDKRKPSWKEDVNNLNEKAKKQIVDYFYDDKGKRNRKMVAYFGIEKQPNKSNSKKGGNR